MDETTVTFQTLSADVTVRGALPGSFVVRGPAWWAAGLRRLGTMELPPWVTAPAKSRSTSMTHTQPVPAPMRRPQDGVSRCEPKSATMISARPNLRRVGAAPPSVAAACGAFELVCERSPGSQPQPQPQPQGGSGGMDERLTTTPAHSHTTSTGTCAAMLLASIGHHAPFS